MSNIKQKITNFLNGYWYPVYIAFFVLVGHIFSVEKYCIIFIGITICTGFIVCDDLKFFISPLVCFYFIFSRKSLISESFYSTQSLIIYLLVVFAIISSIVIHFILYRKEIQIKCFTKASLFKGKRIPR